MYAVRNILFHVFHRDSAILQVDHLTSFGGGYFFDLPPVIRRRQFLTVDKRHKGRPRFRPPVSHRRQVTAVNIRIWIVSGQFIQYHTVRIAEIFYHTFFHRLRSVIIAERDAF